MILNNLDKINNKIDNLELNINRYNKYFSIYTNNKVKNKYLNKINLKVNNLNNYLDIINNSTLIKKGQYLINKFYLLSGGNITQEQKNKYIKDLNILYARFLNLYSVNNIPFDNVKTSQLNEVNNIVSLFNYIHVIFTTLYNLLNADSFPEYNHYINNLEKENIPDIVLNTIMSTVTSDEIMKILYFLTLNDAYGSGAVSDIESSLTLRINKPIININLNLLYLFTLLEKYNNNPNTKIDVVIEYLTNSILFFNYTKKTTTIEPLNYAEFITKFYPHHQNILDKVKSVTTVAKLRRVLKPYYKHDVSLFDQTYLNNLTLKLFYTKQPVTLFDKKYEPTDYTINSIRTVITTTLPRFPSDIHKQITTDDGVPIYSLKETSSKLPNVINHDEKRISDINKILKKLVNPNNFSLIQITNIKNDLLILVLKLIHNYYYYLNNNIYSIIFIFKKLLSNYDLREIIKNNITLLDITTSLLNIQKLIIELNEEKYEVTKYMSICTNIHLTIINIYNKVILFLYLLKFNNKDTDYETLINRSIKRYNTIYYISNNMYNILNQIILFNNEVVSNVFLYTYQLYNIGINILKLFEYNSGIFEINSVQEYEDYKQDMLSTLKKYKTDLIDKFNFTINIDNDFINIIIKIKEKFIPKYWTSVLTNPLNFFYTAENYKINNIIEELKNIKTEYEKIKNSIKYTEILAFYLNEINKPPTSLTYAIKPLLLDPLFTSRTSKLKTFYDSIDLILTKFKTINILVNELDETKYTDSEISLNKFKTNVINIIQTLHYLYELEEINNITIRIDTTIREIEDINIAEDIILYLHKMELYQLFFDIYDMNIF